MKRNSNTRQGSLEAWYSWLSWHDETNLSSVIWANGSLKSLRLISQLRHRDSFSRILINQEKIQDLAIE